jgi:hypothetical protein
MLAAVLAVAGGCGGMNITAPQEEDASGMIGYKEGDMVRVRVNTPNTAAKSILPDDAEKYVNFWEVVFQNVDKTAYYRGTGTPAARNGIDVSVPIGNSYAVLLLGGDMKTKTLLAAGTYRDEDGEIAAVSILPNTMNIVTITLEKTALQWNGDGIGLFDNGDDFDFIVGIAKNTSLGISGYTKRPDETNKVLLFVEPERLPAVTDEDTLTVKVQLSKLNVLGNMNDEGHRYTSYTFDPSSYISLRRRFDDTVVVKKTLKEEDTTIQYYGSMVFTIGNLPRTDIDMVLDVVMKYRAFSREEGGTLWNITNGLYSDVDSSLEDGSATVAETVLNGGILVRFGRGSSETGTDEEGIVIRPGYGTGTRPPEEEKDPEPEPEPKDPRK